MPIEAFCSDRYHITVHCQVSWSFLISPTECAECIVFDPKFKEMSLKNTTPRQKCCQQPETLTEAPVDLGCPAIKVTQQLLCLPHSPVFFQSYYLFTLKNMSPKPQKVSGSTREAAAPFLASSPAFSFPSQPTLPCTHKRVTFFLLLQSYKLFRHSKIILKLINGDLSALMAAFYLSCNSCPDLF